MRDSQDLQRRRTCSGNRLHFEEHIDEESLFPLARNDGEILRVVYPGPLPGLRMTMRSLLVLVKASAFRPVKPGMTNRGFSPGHMNRLSSARPPRGSGLRARSVRQP